jgi:8-oxo-dGTP diphosphatase
MQCPSLVGVPYLGFVHQLPYCPLCGSRIDLVVPGQCGSCGAAHYRNARPTAGGLVVSDNKVLLVRRAIDPWKGHWDIPGGFCNGDELPADAIRREIQEEIGLEIDITELLGMWLDTYELDGSTFDTLNCYFLVDPGPDPTVHLDLSENIEARWFAASELPIDDIAFPKHQREILTTWMKQSGSQVV